MGWTKTEKIREESQGLRSVVVAGKDGRIRCAASLATVWLRKYFPKTDASEKLPPPIRAWLRVEAKKGCALNVARNGNRLVITLVDGETNGPDCLVLQERGVANGAGCTGQKSLTQRETEVLSWVAQGKANWAIGKILHISPATVRKHLQNIYSKLGVENRTAAALCALEIQSVAPDLSNF